MKSRHIVFLLLIIFCLSYYSTDSLAYPHGYRRKTENIYAIIRHEMIAYYYPDPDSETFSLPSFTPIQVTYRGDSWYEIEYTTKKSSGTAWITRDDFYWGCLRYDGRPKQIAADGVYRFREIREADTFSPRINQEFRCEIIYGDRNKYQIRRAGSDSWLRSKKKKGGYKASWGSDLKAGRFSLVRKGKGYLIVDEDTGAFLSTEGGVLCFSMKKPVLWRLRREGKAIKGNSLRNYVQYDGEWADIYYGSGKRRRTETDNFCTAGCGVFAVVNAIYSTTGHFPSPYDLADYAVENYYRIEGSGTDSGFFEAAALGFGSKYGFTFKGTGESLDALKKRLAKGQTAIASVPGHYVTIVDYNPDKDRFLVLDPHYLPRRKTSAFGDWVRRETLEEGGLYISTLYYYDSTE